MVMAPDSKIEPELTLLATNGGPEVENIIVAFLRLLYLNRCWPAGMEQMSYPTILDFC